MSRSQSTRSVEAEKVRAVTAEDDASNDNTSRAQQTLGGAVDGVTFTILGTGAVSPSSADAYPGYTITLEQVQGLSYMEMCARNSNNVCCCSALVALAESQDHLAIGETYTIKEGSDGDYKITVLGGAPLANVVRPTTTTGDLRVGSH